MKRNIYCMLSALILFTNACGTYTRNVAVSSAPRDIIQSAMPRHCAVDVAPVTGIEKLELSEFSGDRSSLRYVLPFGFLNIWSSAGPVFNSGRKIDPEIQTDMTTLIRNTLRRSGIASGTGKRYRLETDVLRFYGVSYIKAISAVGITGYLTGAYRFWPTGFASLRLMLVDVETGKTVSTSTLSGEYLLNRDHPAISSTAMFEAGQNCEYRSEVACIALSRLMEELPLTVDRMLAEADRASVFSKFSGGAFTVACLTDEYDYQEEVSIDFSTGRILSDNVVRRTSPIVSRPGEWYVLPVLNGHYLSGEEYRTLVQSLGSRYRVSFNSNVSATSFGGIK